MPAVAKLRPRLLIAKPAVILRPRLMLPGLMPRAPDRRAEPEIPAEIQGPPSGGAIAENCFSWIMPDYAEFRCNLLAGGGGGGSYNALDPNIAQGDNGTDSRMYGTGVLLTARRGGGAPGNVQGGLGLHGGGTGANTGATVVVGGGAAGGAGCPTNWGRGGNGGRVHGVWAKGAANAPIVGEVYTICAGRGGRGLCFNGISGEAHWSWSVP